MATIYERCPLCGGLSSPRYLPVDDMGRTWRIDRCASCGVGFLNPTLKGAELDPFYSDEYYGPGHHRFSGGAEGIIPLFRRARARKVMRLMPNGGAILDVGCGRGIMLAELARRGHRCVGIERSESAAKDARKWGLTVHSGNIEDLGLPENYFDLITFWQVIEHVERPVEAIAEAARILKSGGRLLAQVPDIDGLQARITGDSWFHLDPPRHLWHFNMRSLDLLMSKAGLMREHVGHLSIEYGPFGMLQSLMNVAGVRRDLLFDLLMSRDKKALLPSSAAHGALWAAVAILGPLSFAIDIAASALKSGSVIEAVYRKP